MLNDETNALSMFRLYTAHFYQPDTTKASDEITLAELIFRTKGGISLHDKNEIESCPARLTHIFVDDSAFDEEKFKENMHTLGVALHDVAVINCNWIRACHESNKLICDKSYKIVLI